MKPIQALCAAAAALLLSGNTQFFVPDNPPPALETITGIYGELNFTSERAVCGDRSHCVLVYTCVFAHEGEELKVAFYFGTGRIAIEDTTNHVAYLDDGRNGVLDEVDVGEGTALRKVVFTSSSSNEQQQMLKQYEKLLLFGKSCVEFQERSRTF